MQKENYFHAPIYLIQSQIFLIYYHLIPIHFFIFYTGSLKIEDCTRLRAGTDFKLSLDYYTLDYIWEDVTRKANLEVQSVCEDIFNEVKNYTKSLKDKSIPFDLFLKVVREQYKQTPSSELWYLRNKLVSYSQNQIFAKKAEDIELLSSALKNDKVTIIDFSFIPINWHKAFTEFILRTVQQDVYLFMRLNDVTSSAEIVNKIYGNNKIKVIPSASYGYKKLPSIVENCNNYIFLPTLNQTKKYGYVNSAIWGLDSNYALLFGEDTKNFIFKIQNTINIDEEDKKLKKFYIAATSVYVSGTILITVLSATVSKLTVGNVIALETVILFVYVFDTYMLKRIAKNIADYEKAVIENRDKKDDVEKE